MVAMFDLINDGVELATVFTVYACAEHLSDLMGA